MAKKYQDGFRLGDRVILPNSGKVIGPDGEVRIQPRIMDVLLCLAEHEGEIVDRETLVTAVWGHTAVTDDSVNKSISKIRSCLGDDPKEQRFVETLPKRGYRLLTRVTPIDRGDSADEGLVQTQSAITRVSTSRYALIGGVGGVLAAVVIALLVVPRVVLDDGLGFESFDPPENSIAVVPFQDLSTNSAYEYFGDGLAEDLQISLSRIDDLTVIARSSSVAASQRSDDARVVGQQLNVHSVLEGSVRLSDKRIRVTARLVNTKDGVQIWSQSYDRQPQDIFAVQNEIANNVSRALEVELLDNASMFNSEWEPSFDAYNLYLLGRSYLRKRTPESLALATEHFKQATNLDPKYALAYSGLVDSYVFQTMYSNLTVAEAKVHATPAIDAARYYGDALAETHLSAGRYHDYLDIDNGRSRLAYGRALELDQNNVQVLRAIANTFMGGTGMPRASELINQAAQIDPLNQAVATTKINLLMRMGRYEAAMNFIDNAPWIANPEPDLLRVIALWIGAYGSPTDALTWAEKSLEMSPNSALGHLAFVQIYLQTGNLERANAHLAEAAEAAPSNLSIFVWRAKVLAASGDLHALRQHTQSRLLQSQPSPEESFSYSWFWSHYYHGLANLLDHQYEEAVQHLQKANDLELQFNKVSDSAQIELQIFLARAYFLLGREETAVQVLRSASLSSEAAKANGWDTPQLAHSAASILALQGRTAAALSALEETLAGGPTSGTMGSWKGHWSMRFDPTLDSLRDEERFRRLLR